MNSLLFINTPITLYSCSLHRKCYHYFFVTGLRCLRQRCDCPVTRFQDRSYSERSETATLAQLYSPSDSRTSPSATKPRPCVTSHPDGLTPLVTAPSCCPYSAFGSDNQETHQQHTHCWCQYDSSFTTASGCGDEWSDGEKRQVLRREDDNSGSYMPYNRKANLPWYLNDTKRFPIGYANITDQSDQWYQKLLASNKNWRQRTCCWVCSRDVLVYLAKCLREGTKKR